MLNELATILAIEDYETTVTFKDEGSYVQAWNAGIPKYGVLVEGQYVGKLCREFHNLVPKSPLRIKTRRLHLSNGQQFIFHDQRLRVENVRRIGSLHSTLLFGRERDRSKWFATVFEKQVGDSFILEPQFQINKTQESDTSPTARRSKHAKLT